MNDSYTFQIGELKKLGFVYFERLAHGGEPLTYSFADEKEAKPVQVEVGARFPKKAKGVLVTVDFCSDQGKWMHKSDTTVTYLTQYDNSWYESSYDGSEFEN